MKTQPFCSSLAAMPNVCVYCGLGINANADPWTQTVWILWGDPFADGAEHWAPLHLVCSHRLHRRIIMALAMLRWARLQARGGGGSQSSSGSR
jgi:hypothetical protein